MNVVQNECKLTVLQLLSQPKSKQFGSKCTRGGHIIYRASIQTSKGGNIKNQNVDIYHISLVVFGGDQLPTDT